MLINQRVAIIFLVLLKEIFCSEDLGEEGSHFEGDINLNGLTINHYITKTEPVVKTGGLRLANAVASPLSQWPNREVAYVISQEFEAGERKTINQALDELERDTCLTFIRRSDQKDYMYIEKGDMCSSHLGRIGGRQSLMLSQTCLTKGMILHQLLHAIGFVHEQSRPDRDDYVQIDWDNVKTSAAGYLQIYSLRDVKLLDTKYDYTSILHLPLDAFSKNGKDTIIPKNPLIHRVGQRLKLTKLDKLKVNKFYGCPNYKGSGEIIDNSNIAKDGAAEVADKLSLCKDQFDKCSDLASKCRILRVKATCPITCDSCKTFLKFWPGNSGKAKCLDRNEKCNQFAKQGYCERIQTRERMFASCCLSCNKPLDVNIL